MPVESQLIYPERENLSGTDVGTRDGRGFLVCPVCFQAVPAEVPRPEYQCRFCRHRWMAPAGSLTDIYFASVDEIEVSLTAAEGERYVLRTLPAVIGRDSEFRVLQCNLAVSRRHCRIDFDRARGRFFVTPFRTGGGTFLNGEALPPEEPHEIFPGDALVLSGVLLSLRCRLNRELPGKPGEMIRLGRSLNLSAEMEPGFLNLAEGDSEVTVTPVRTADSVAAFSRNAVSTAWTLYALDRDRIRINGLRFLEQKLSGGERLEIGRCVCVFDSTESSLKPAPPGGGAEITIRRLSAGYRRRVVLREVSCRIPKGKLTAILGKSGCGKSTLIKVLSGQKRPISGEILVDGAAISYPQWAEKHLALVPQFDVVHPELTVRQCIAYAADIRIGTRANGGVKQAVVEKAIRDAGLTRFSGRYVGELSGGQRKRVNIAVEAVGRPEVLLLDEPTTGLDYATEKLIVAGLRRISRQGETVVFVTHSLSTIEAADHVIVLNGSEEGSRVAAEGSPQEVRTAIGVESWQELYSQIDSGSREEEGMGRVAARPESHRAPGAFALFSRYVRIWLNSPLSSLALLFGLPLLLGVLIRLAVSIDAPLGTDRLVFGLVAMFWLGMNQTVREIIREREIFLQEHAHHVSSLAYLLSKTLFFLLVSFPQALLMTLPILWLNVNSGDGFLKFDQLAAPFFAVLPMMWLAGGVGCVFGLFGSALSLFLRKQGEIAAVLFAVIATLPQFLFSAKVLPEGLAKPLNPEHFYTFAFWHENAPVAEALSYFTFSRYLFVPLDAVSTGQTGEIVARAFVFNCGILAMAMVCMMAAAWTALEIFAWRARRF